MFFTPQDGNLRCPAGIPKAVTRLMRQGPSDAAYPQSKLTGAQSLAALAQSNPNASVRDCVRKQKKRPFEGPLSFSLFSNLLIRLN
jgi:hypothetical protein